MLVTDKIGYASFLILQNCKLLEVRTKNRNRSSFVFDLNPNKAVELELQYTQSEFSKFFQAFQYLRDRTIRGAGGK